jgi:23S rRNA pseudouridine2457 synthase
MAKLILFNKPYNVLSQFTDADGRQTLADYIDIPEVYPAGRLDYDSEGLVLLTDNGSLQHRISHPKHKLAKTYWVQVEGNVSSQALAQISRGLTLKDGPTKPAKVKVIDEPGLWPRDPPVRFRQHIPTHWLELTIAEGRNRQVRRMTAAVGLPTLRLVRQSVGQWSLEDIRPGDYRIETLHPSVQKTAPKLSHARKYTGKPSNKVHDNKQKEQK